MAKVTDKDMEKYISGGGKMFKFRDPRNGEVTEFIDNASNRGKVKRIVQRYISIRGDGTHQDYLKKKAGTAEKVGAVALFAIPGGGFIRLGTMGTKAAANALKAARAKFPKGKVVTNPSAAQVRNAKPVGSVPAGGSRTKPTSKDKPTTVRQDKPRVRVPATTRGGASSKRMPTSASGSGRPMSTRQMLDKVRANAAKRTKPPKPLTAAQRAAIAGRSAAPAVKGAVSDTSKATTPKVTRSGAASKRMPVVSKKTTPKISASAAAEKRNIKTYGKPLIPSRSSALVSLTGKPAETGAAFKKKKNGAKPAPKSTPKTTKSGAASKRMPTAKKRTAPSTASEAGRKGTPKRTTRITAGPNVGFGPKGNIYPRDAADRRRLMAKYGGTGSAAARAAAQGKQGNMKKGSK